MVKGKLELHILWKSVGMKENMERLLIGRKAMGIPRFIAPRFIALLRYCLFYKLNVWQPHTEQVCQCHFSSSILLCVSVTFC